ncbi:MAG: DUF4214 domain-containing protein [Desulfobacteraceae bacterium]|nr:DUF4214 domain-containing protein [Desulfobacteraceae bacterium]
MKLKTVFIALVCIVLSSVSAFAQLSKNDISMLYVSIFNRASEGGGNAFWQPQPDMAWAADEMLRTPAAKNYFGASLNSNQAFIEHIYQNTLNKTLADDPQGIAHWVGRLDAGQTRGAVVAELVGAIKNYAPGGPSYDPNNAKTVAAYNQFTNRVSVSDFMADTVQEPPANWETATQFSSAGLNVTYDAATVTAAQAAIVNFTSGGTSELEADILAYMDMISSAGELSPMMDEIGTLLEEIMNADSSVVTFDPALPILMESLNDITKLPEEITVTADFNPGYTPDPENSTAVYTGQTVINITNLAFSDTGINANAALTATDVRRDGELVLTGAMTMDINVGMAGSGIVVNIPITFSNLQSLDYQINGRVAVSTTVSTDGQLLAPVVIAFDNLTSQDFNISSGTVEMTQTETADGFDALFNLNTHEGLVNGLVQLTETQQGDTVQTIVSTPGTMTAGAYTVDINNVVMDPDTCQDLPVGGNIVISGAGETKTLVFSNCTYTIN